MGKKLRSRFSFVRETRVNTDLIITFSGSQHSREPWWCQRCQVSTWCWSGECELTFSCTCAFPGWQLVLCSLRHRKDSRKISSSVICGLEQESSLSSSQLPLTSRQLNSLPSRRFWLFAFRFIMLWAQSFGWSPLSLSRTLSLPPSQRFRWLTSKLKSVPDLSLRILKYWRSALYSIL